MDVVPEVFSNPANQSAMTQADPGARCDLDRLHAAQVDISWFAHILLCIFEKV